MAIGGIKLNHDVRLEVAVLEQTKVCHGSAPVFLNQSKQMLAFGKIEGPGFSIPVTGLVLGMFLFQLSRD
jgi:hypothetical protein